MHTSVYAETFQFPLIEDMEPRHRPHTRDPTSVFPAQLSIESVQHVTQATDDSANPGYDTVSAKESISIWKCVASFAEYTTTGNTDDITIRLTS